ncbi:hypothetical protein J4210_03100 [Candidatus Woesearchaeota archaeon]|nr:hypothetical protein [Candidatus Woesearchaeota archaeon]
MIFMFRLFTPQNRESPRYAALLIDMQEGFTKHLGDRLEILVENQCRVLVYCRDQGIPAWVVESQEKYKDSNYGATISPLQSLLETIPCPPPIIKMVVFV